MAELVILVEKNKADLVSALKMKSSLWDKGIVVSGVVLTNGNPPAEFVEDLMQLRVRGSLN